MNLSRQELVLGKKAIQKLSSVKVAIIGLGSLGSVTSELLVRSGIKNLILIDRDYIEEVNLTNQKFTKQDLNQPKVLIVEKNLKQINPDLNIKSHFDNLDNTNIDLIKSDLVLDCTDNLETRFLIDEYCHKNDIPWVFASVIRSSGYVLNIIPNKISFKDIFDKFSNTETCEVVGVLNSAVSLISSLQVSEAIKILTNNSPEENLIYINLATNDLIKIKVSKSKNYNYEYLSGKNITKTIKLCGQGNYLFPLNKDFNKLKKLLKPEIDFKTAFKYKELTVFKNKVLIKAKDEKQAKTIYSKYIGN